MPSDRSDAGIRLLGYSAARRRTLKADEALRVRRVGPRPDGLLPRSLPAVVSGRRVLPVQRGDYAPGWDHPGDDYYPSGEHRPLIDELSTEELAREAVASLRQHNAPPEQQSLTPELLDLGAAGPSYRADRRVPSGRHRNNPKSAEPPVKTAGRQRVRIGWAVAAAGVLALGTGFTALAMTSPQTDQQPVPASTQVLTPPTTPAQAPVLTDPTVISSTQSTTPTAALPTEIVPLASVAPPPVSTAGPAVVSTLGSGDAGFGWPSSAFGTSNP